MRLILFSIWIIQTFLFHSSICKVYDLIVVGLGSGGLATVKRAASYGAKIAVIEKDGFGGTCVNVGCVPKKVIWTAGYLASTKRLYSKYGLFDSLFELKKQSDEQFVSQQAKFTNSQQDKSSIPWFGMEVNKKARDSYIKRIHHSYERIFSSLPTVDLFFNFEAISVDTTSNLKSVTCRHNRGDKNETNITVKGSRILISTGGRPTIPLLLSNSRGITSDEFWTISDPNVPETVVIVGGGYIAAELASILKALGSRRVILVVRARRLLPTFDFEIINALHRELIEGQGIEILYQHHVTNVSKPTNSLPEKNRASARVSISPYSPSETSFDELYLDKKTKKKFPSDQENSFIPEKDKWTECSNIDNQVDYPDEDRANETINIDADVLIWAIGRYRNFLN